MRAMTRLAWAALGLAVLVTGCAERPDPKTLDELRTNSGPPIYWLGDAYGDLPLSYVDHFGKDSNFVYGTCEVEMHGTEGSCSPPLAIQQWRLRDRQPSLFVDRTCRRYSVRGALVGDFTRAGFDTEVYTGSSTIVIFTDGTIDERQVIEAFVAINDGGEPGDPLPPPPPSVAKALSFCRPASG